MALSERPRHPCLTNPNPRSVKPDLIVHHRSFQHHHLLQYEKNYPYNLKVGEVGSGDTDSLTVHFFEFRGYGPPPADVGTPGDIYIDMTSDAYALYAMISPTTWKQWEGHRRSTVHGSGRVRFQLSGIHHPHLEDRMLWVADRSVVWYVLKTIQNDDRSKKPCLDAKYFLAQLMEYELGEIKKYGGTRKRGAPDEEGEGDRLSSKKGKVDKGVDVQTNDMSFHSPDADANSPTDTASESEIIDGGKVQIGARAEEGDKGLKEQSRLQVENEKLKNELTDSQQKLSRWCQAYKTLVERKEKADSDSISFSQRVAELESENTILEAEIKRIQRENRELQDEREQGRNSFNSTSSRSLQSDGLSIVDTSYLRDEALDNLPDGVKNDLDAHIKNFLSAIKDKDDACRKVERMEKVIADKDACIQTLLDEAKEHQSARAFLFTEVSNMAKQIQELVSERDRAQAEEEATKKSLADKEAKIRLILDH